MLEQIKREAAGANAAVASRVGDPMDVVLTAIEHAKPLIETRPVRVGGTIYQVPTPVPPARRQSLAVKWIVRAARDRKSPHKMSERLYKEVRASCGPGPGPGRCGPGRDTRW
jgi:small subunit ribosomal protein S7